MSVISAEATSLATRVSTNPEALERAVSWSRQWSAEYPHCLANHLPMVLVALHRMGADDARLDAYCRLYHEMNRLVPPPHLVAVDRENWRDFLGRRECEGDYRAFFFGEVARLGADRAAKLYLPTLFGGFAASALHAFMRMAYATMTDSDEETAVALGYWAATYLTLGASQGSPPATEDPAQVLAYMYGPPSFRHVEIEQDLLWHFLRAVAAKPDFAEVFDMLAIGPQTHDRIAKLSLEIHAAAGDFASLHAVTGAHWLRLMAPRTPDPALALRPFWQAIAALVPKIGFPEMPTAEALQQWRAMRLPDWPEIYARGGDA